VVAYLALFVALSTGGAYAANTIGSSDVIDESLISQDFKNGEVRGPDIANGAVTRDKIGGSAVTTAKVSDGSLGAQDLGPDSVGASEVVNDSLAGTDVDESTLGLVPNANNANNLAGLPQSSFMRAPTKWKSLSTIGERLPVEIGNPPCSGNRECTATIRCDPGDVLLSGGFERIDNGTRLISAFPFNANGYDQKYVVHWDNNSTADTVTLDILCANQ
jgi:hypothetical protein